MMRSSRRPERKAVACQSLGILRADVQRRPESLGRLLGLREQIGNQHERLKEVITNNILLTILLFAVLHGVSVKNEWLVSQTRLVTYQISHVVMSLAFFV
jgi:hypothetical protein